MTNYTTYNIAREAYFVITLGDFDQPMTWANAQTGAVPFDMFQGGSAAAIPLTPNATNIYHIFEYKSGHLMVEKFGA